jgi:hypothetical protein
MATRDSTNSPSWAISSSPIGQRTTTSDYPSPRHQGRRPAPNTEGSRRQRRYIAPADMTDDSAVTHLASPHGHVCEDADT